MMMNGGLVPVLFDTVGAEWDVVNYTPDTSVNRSKEEQMEVTRKQRSSPAFGSQDGHFERDVGIKIGGIKDKDM
jgi:hypothetical protein